MLIFLLEDVRIPDKIVLGFLFLLKKQLNSKFIF
jgi:hypothetical protein